MKGCITITNLIHATEFIRSYYSALGNGGYRRYISIMTTA